MRPVPQQSVTRPPNKTIKKYFKEVGKCVQVKQSPQAVDVTFIFKKGKVEQVKGALAAPEHVVGGYRFEVAGHCE